MATVYLALGSNVGDSRQAIKQAVELLAKKVHDLQIAPLYASTAVGYIDQPDFLNTAVSGQTTLSPQELLIFVKGIEQQIGRVERFRWGPREIDIDIILYDDTVLETAELTLPHPEFRNRDFVLRPLCDLNPDALDPVSGRSIAQLLDDLPATSTSILKRVDEN